MWSHTLTLFLPTPDALTPRVATRVSSHITATTAVARLRHRARQKKKAAQPAGSEDAYNAAFCSAFGGHTETRHTYQYPGGSSYVKVDCETDTTVYEGGLDKRSNLDSVQQALFFASLTGKEPAVVIYNTDGRIGKYEHRM